MLLMQQSKNGSVPFFQALTKLVDDGLPPLRSIDLMVGALKPSHDCIYPCVSCPRDELRKGHCYTQQIAQLWWDQWVIVYTVMLQKRQKWRKTRREFKVGDLILLCEEPAPRILKYPFAVITDVSLAQGFPNFLVPRPHFCESSLPRTPLLSCVNFSPNCYKSIKCNTKINCA